MLRQITYALTTSVIKTKGIKKIFSSDPINVVALRKDDVYQSKNSFIQRNSHHFTIEKCVVTAVSRSKKSEQLTIFIHGGAFISGPAAHHWAATKTIVKQTQQEVWMCDYPKAPEHSIEEMKAAIKAVYQKALEKFDPSQITIMGDSAGGTLTFLLIQSLIAENEPLPKQLIAICPVTDASLNHEDVEHIDKLDVMLSKKGVVSAKKMALKSDDLQQATISPIYGIVKGFPKTTFFLGTYDITYPDAVLFAEKLKQNGTQTTVFIGEKMPHIYPLLPVMIDAKEALQQIVKLLQ